MEDTCQLCTEAIQDGDKTAVLGGVTLKDNELDIDVVLAHVECLLRNLVGGPACVEGVCDGLGAPHETGMTFRQEALWVADFMRNRKERAKNAVNN